MPIETRYDYKIPKRPGRLVKRYVPLIYSVSPNQINEAIARTGRDRPTWDIAILPDMGTFVSANALMNNELPEVLRLTIHAEDANPLRKMLRPFLYMDPDEWTRDEYGECWRNSATGVAVSGLSARTMDVSLLKQRFPGLFEAISPVPSSPTGSKDRKWKRIGRVRADEIPPELMEAIANAPPGAAVRVPSGKTIQQLIPSLDAARYGTMQPSKETPMPRKKDPIADRFTEYLAATEQINQKQRRTQEAALIAEQRRQQEAFQQQSWNQALNQKPGGVFRGGSVSDWDWDRPRFDEMRRELDRLYAMGIQDTPQKPPAAPDPEPPTDTRPTNTRRFANIELESDDDA